MISKNKINEPQRLGYTLDNPVVILRNDRSLLSQKYGEFSEGRTNNYQDVEDIKKVLEKLGKEYIEFEVKEDLSNLDEIKELNPEFVINLCDDFLNPETEAEVPKKLEDMGIPYTGDTSYALVICTQKALQKELFVRNRVTTPKYRLVSLVRNNKVAGLRYPLIVKPNREHGSIGIDENSIVYNPAQLQKKLDEMIQRYKEVLVEQYIEGRELSALVIDGKVMKVSEINFSNEEFSEKPKIMGYDAKWNEGTEEYQGTVRNSARLPKTLESRVRKASKEACKAVGCTGYARVDLRLDEEGIPYVLEVNVNPDLSIGGAVQKIAASAGMSYFSLIKTIFKKALDKAKLWENREVKIAA